jgi:hypothetical protein
MQNKAGFRPNERVRCRRIEWHKITFPILNKVAPALCQCVMEKAITDTVARLNAVGALCRVELQNNKARIFGSNGQKVVISLI